MAAQAPDARHSSTDTDADTDTGTDTDEDTGTGTDAGTDTEVGTESEADAGAFLGVLAGQVSTVTERDLCVCVRAHIHMSANSHLDSML